MLQVTLIGHIGGDADFRNENGREFTAFRVAHSDRWTDDAGQVHETTTWVDCVMDGKPKVFDFLRKGTLVFVQGSAALRVYSSAKDRCMKAGLRVRVRSVELLGGKADDVPARLYDTNDGTEFAVVKYFQAAQLVRDEKSVELYPLVDRSGGRYVVDRNGWVQRFVESNDTENGNNG